jgi:hypothetical protein
MFLGALESDKIFAIDYLKELAILYKTNSIMIKTFPFIASIKFGKHI